LKESKTAFLAKAVPEPTNFYFKDKLLLKFILALRIIYSFRAHIFVNKIFKGAFNFFAYLHLKRLLNLKKNFDSCVLCTKNHISSAPRAKKQPLCAADIPNRWRVNRSPPTRELCPL
jgi:hypothetical protein